MSLLSEQELRLWITEIGQKGPRRGLPELFRRYRRGERLELASLQLVLQGICIKGSPWLAALRTSVRKGGACPKEIRQPIQKLISIIEHKGVSSTAAILRRGRVAAQHARLEISEPQETGLMSHQQLLLLKIQEISADGGPIDLTIRFDCDRVYVYGLALIAAWCSCYAASVRVETAFPHVSQYLRQIGFLDVVEQQRRIDSPQYDATNHVAITQILRESTEESDSVAGRLADLFVRHIHLSRENQRALYTVFAELIENVHRHAQNDYPGYVIAQAHPAKRRLHVVVVDPGIGILNSFLQSDKTEVRDRARSEAEALDMAIELYTTSKTHNHSGYGLYVVSRLLQHNQGVFRLTSGTRTLLIRPNPEARSLKQAVAVSKLRHARWQGTELGLQFNLDEPMPLRTVYATMGGQEEDYF